MIIQTGEPFQQLVRVSAGELPDQSAVTLTESVRADFPISLAFTGSALSGVQISSQGSVLLGDAIVSTSVLVSSDGSIDATSSFDQITADTVTLQASAGIGRLDAPLTRDR